MFFSDNGAGAVEVALKLSFQYWQLTGRPEKRGVIGMAGRYHGDTFGAMAAGDSGAFHDRFRPWCFPADHFPAPVCREWNGVVRESDATASLRSLEALLDARAPETACLILEPSVQGAAGMRLQPPGFVRAVADLCRAHGVHLILDEVFVAFGRLGPMLVCASEGVTPDFLCLAKGLTAGYLPLAATLASEEVFAAFLGSHDSGRAFYHGHTFTGNPLAAAVALENIRKLRPLIDGGVLKSPDRPLRPEDRRGLRREPPDPGDPPARPDRRPSTSSPSARGSAGTAVCLRARDRGLILRPLGRFAAPGPLRSASPRTSSTSSSTAPPGPSRTPFPTEPPSTPFTMTDLDSIRQIYELPLPELIFRAQQAHREHHDPAAIQLCTLQSIKTGRCPEDCKYCPQSAHHDTGLEAEPLMDAGGHLPRPARRRAGGGATRFCMGAAWREVRDGPAVRLRPRPRSAASPALGLEVCCTLGMLTAAQAGRLKEAGCAVYNHNLDTSREFYPAIITTRTYDERLATLGAVRAAGLQVCSRRHPRDGRDGRGPAQAPRTSSPRSTRSRTRFRSTRLVPVAGPRSPRRPPSIPSNSCGSSRRLGSSCHGPWSGSPPAGRR